MDEGTSYGLYKGSGKPSGAWQHTLKIRKRKTKKRN